MFADLDNTTALKRQTIALTDVRLAHGRALVFSPQWECSDASVVFDRNSGDYWIVSSLAAAVLEQFQQHPEPTPSGVTQIESRLVALSSYADLRTALDLTLQNLIDNQLLEHAGRANAGADGLN